MSLEHLISEQLLPTMIGCEISLPERTLFCLPARFGGLNVLNPTSNDNINYSSSRRLTRLITDALKGNCVFDIAEYCAEYHSVQEEINKAKEELLEELFSDVLLPEQKMKRYPLGLLFY